jgi:predicted dehydrogenase
LVGSPRTASPWLLQALSRIGTLEAICHEHAEQDAGRYQARWAFTDTQSMLAEAAPDGIIVEQPLAERLATIKHCLAAGVGVLVNGAPSTAAACKRLGTMAALAGRILLAAPAIRFAPVVAVARRLLDSGRFGTPISVTLHSSRRGAARTGPKDDGPVPLDQVFEAVDLLHHLLGPIQSVFAVAHREGSLAATGETGAGVLVSLLFHASGPAHLAGVRMELRAADGAVLLIDQNCHLVCGNGSRVDAAHGVSLAIVDPVLELGFEGLLAEFRRYLEDGRQSPGLVGPVPAVLAATEAVLGSAEKKRPVVPRYEGGIAQSRRRRQRQAEEGTCER